ncbi:MAG: cytochrome oxidase small assembly protein [Burkholderiaceae bacterium]|jgi:hypothetical protein
MTRNTVTTDSQQPVRRRPANVRTALVLLSIAAVFFAGIIAKRVFMG